MSVLRNQSDRDFMRGFMIMIAMLALAAAILTVIGTLVWASLPGYSQKAQVKQAENRISPVAAVYAGKAGHAAVQAAKPSGPTASAKQPAGPYKYVAAKGKQLFATHCAVCHQATGMGLPHVFPPLKGNAAVENADPAVQIKTILHGKHGVAIDGKTYSGTMTPFASVLTNAEIATVANYERSSWGNHGKHIKPSDVAAIRAKSK